MLQGDAICCHCSHHDDDDDSKTLESNDFVDETGAEWDHVDVSKAEPRCIRRRRRCGSSLDKDAGSMISSARCVICLDSYHEGDEVVWSNNEDHCTHCLHLECALDYFVFLKDDSHPCPVCRQTFLLPPQGTDSATPIDNEQEPDCVLPVVPPQTNRDDDELPV